MHEVQVGFEELENGHAWVYFKRSCPLPGEAPIADVLCWLLEQVNFGFIELHFDADDVVSVTIGRDAAPSYEPPVLESVERDTRQRHCAVQIARVIAWAREGGCRVEDHQLVEDIRFRASESSGANIKLNTEIHYAFELLSLLKMLPEKSLELATPPIRGVLSTRSSSLLREATRAYLYGLNSAAVAFCRAAVESSLKDLVDRADVERHLCYQPHEGVLEALINVAHQQKLLTGIGRDQAHSIRRLGNDVMHDRELGDADTRQSIRNLRFILEELAPASG